MLTQIFSDIAFSDKMKQTETETEIYIYIL